MPKGRRLPKKPAEPVNLLTPEQRLLILDAWQRSGLPAGARGSIRRIAAGNVQLPGVHPLLGASRAGSWIVKRRTAADRFRCAAKMVAEWCRRHRHRPIPEQHAALSRKLRGHYAYYGVTGNMPALLRFQYAAGELWRKWLGRRSWAGPVSWDQFHEAVGRFPLPWPEAVHSVYRC